MKKFIYIFLLLGFIISCNKDNLITNQSVIKFSGNNKIENYDTRSSSIIKDGDKLSFFYKEDNSNKIKYTTLVLKNNNWQSTNTIELSSGKYLCIYPEISIDGKKIIEEGTSNIIDKLRYYFYSNNTQNREEYNRLNFSYCTGRKEVNNNIININLKKAFHLITIKNNDGISGNIELSCPEYASFNSDFDLISSDNSGNININLTNEDNNIIVFPLQKSINIQYKNNGESHDIKLSKDLSSLERGKNTIINLGKKQLIEYNPSYTANIGEKQGLRPENTLINQGLFSNTRQFIYGVKVPDPQSVIFYNNMKYYSWTKDCGWYDVNKSWNYGLGDSDMCWAASCSNVIYWWLEHNKDNILRYMPNYHFPKYIDDSYNQETNTEVFNFYRGIYANLGRYPTVPLIQYFYKIEEYQIPKSARRNKSASIEDLHLQGDFYHLFSSLQDFTSRCKVISINDLHSLNTAIKQGLVKNRAMIMIVQTKLNKDSFGRPYTHAITLWGAGFDSNGNVNKLYLTDNNDYRNYYAKLPRTKRALHLGLIETNVDIVNGKPCAAQIFNDVDVEILSVSYLDLFTDHWKNLN